MHRVFNIDNQNLHFSLERTL